MSLTKEEVLKIAKLSKLSFEEAEIEKVLLNAPESAENAIVVPKVVGE